MKNLLKSFSERRETLQKLTWLRPTLFAADLILLIVSLFTGQILGFILGLLLILLNEWLTPIIVQRIFVKELHGELKATGSLTTKVIRHKDGDVEHTDKSG